MQTDPSLDASSQSSRKTAPFTFETLDTAPVAETAIIDAGLDAWNCAAAPLNAIQPVTCVARAPSGEVVGGAVGRTWGECAELQQLWVESEHRRNGIGSELVRLFEARAKARGCRTLYLTTFSFQAPALYQSLGYRPAVEVRGFPSGIVKYVMVRTVEPDEV
jgi:ribosomal protein S18 acetylase RimI-like enzyme